MANKTYMYTDLKDRKKKHNLTEVEILSCGKMYYYTEYVKTVFPGIYKLNPVANRSEYIADKDMPFCPICNTRMYVLEFKGYYDKLTTWKCACDELPPPTRFQYSEYGKLHAEELYKGQLG